MTTTPWPAPAKLNLFLHVVGRRPDGYHLLQTVFQFLDLADELHFTPTEDGRIRCERNYQQPAEREDLVVIAARKLQKLGDSAQGAAIRVNKKIPMGGGLGGGSSDAATTLVALNHLWGTGLTNEQLAAAGLELGADVPVFVHGHAAWAEGVGETLRPVRPPENWYLLIYPNVPVSTREVFNDPELPRTTPPVAWQDFLRGDCRNDCEAVVRRVSPATGAALDWLGARAPAHLSGTGACVFAEFEERAAAAALLDETPAHWRGFIAKGINRSPLACCFAP